MTSFLLKHFIWRHIDCSLLRHKSSGLAFTWRKQHRAHWFSRHGQVSSSREAAEGGVVDTKHISHLLLVGRVWAVCVNGVLGYRLFITSQLQQRDAHGSTSPPLAVSEWVDPSHHKSAGFIVFYGDVMLSMTACSKPSSGLLWKSAHATSPIAAFQSHWLDYPHHIVNVLRAGAGAPLCLPAAPQQPHPGPGRWFPGQKQMACTSILRLLYPTAHLFLRDESMDLLKIQHSHNKPTFFY